MVELPVAAHMMRESEREIEIIMYQQEIEIIMYQQEMEIIMYQQRASLKGHFNYAP